MKTVVISIFSFLALVFVGHILFGNSFPTLTVLLERFENASFDFVETFAPFRDWYSEFQALMEAYERVDNFRVVTGLGSGFDNFWNSIGGFLVDTVGWFAFVLQGIQGLLFAVVRCLGALLGDFLNVLFGSFSILFGVGA